jgi:hypothetical protein
LYFYGGSLLLSAFFADTRHVFAVLAHFFSTFSANLRHVLAISADGKSAFAGSFPAAIAAVPAIPAAARAALITCHSYLLEQLRFGPRLNQQPS